MDFRVKAFDGYQSKRKNRKERAQGVVLSVNETLVHFEGTGPLETHHRRKTRQVAKPICQRKKGGDYLALG